MSGTDGTVDAWAEWTTPGAAAFGVVGLAAAAVGHVIGDGDDEDGGGGVDLDGDADADRTDVTQQTTETLVDSTNAGVQLMAADAAQHAYGDAITSYCDPDGPGF
ncbi:hypothetical protein [Kineosporia sp. R_H_3]|uniref:hypothetical protein n=1 Tax=Kineosporia sp. R_H_3 TaxID=1961848 RepID=UPI000B4BCBA3|nr:hypothetical protein [Kineosporia sp. R_H_3]